MAEQIGYYMASPVLFVNLGCEIIYILDQRLRAFTIDIEKQQKILNDILKALYNPQIIQQIFKPQKLFSYNFIKQLLKKVINCSIMNMNETSSNKLFDLTFMGVKYQMITCQSPMDLYFITLNHLTGVMNILQQGSSLQYVKQFEKTFRDMYSDKTPVFYIQIKQELLKFLQTKQMRIYMFIYDKKCQNDDGSFIITNVQEKAAPFVGKPGLVECFDIQGNLTKRQTLILKIAQNYKVNESKSFLEFSNTQLGKNMYEKNENMTIVGQGNRQKTTYESDQQLKKAMRINEQQAKQNINQLASAIRGEEDEDDDTAFTISSLKQSNTQSQAQQGDILGMDDNDFKFDLVTVDNSKSGQQKIQSTINEMFGDIDIKVDDENQEQDNEQDGDDLLDMMDNL